MKVRYQNLLCILSINLTCDHGLQNFKEMVEVVFVEEMKIFESRLSQHASSKARFDLSDMFYRFTLDGFCNIGFGVSFRLLENVYINLCIFDFF